jgi:hypothetical protein
VTTTAGGGYYTLSVSPFADTYTVKASSPGFKGSISGVSVSSDPTAAPDIILDVDPDYHPNRLVYLKASDLSMGTNLASWPNLGLLGGTFDKFTGGTGPDVVSVLGKKAVQFLQPTSDGTARRTLASATPAPTSLSGNNPWTMHAVIYRDDASITGDNCFFKWAGLRTRAKITWTNQLRLLN